MGAAMSANGDEADELATEVEDQPRRLAWMAGKIARGEGGFSLGRRGYDPAEVQHFAAAVATELAQLDEHLADLSAALADAEERAERELDDDVVLRYLGEESARLLETARVTAAQARARADEDAAHRRAEAEAWATDLVRDAEQRAAASARDADERTAAVLAAAHAEARDIVQVARDQAADLLADAERQRAEVLADLHRRRQEIEDQIKRQLDGRDRLAHSIRRTRDLADDALEELRTILPTSEPVDGTDDEVGQITIIS